MAWRRGYEGLTQDVSNKFVTIQLLEQFLVAVQIASDLFEYQEKARSIQVYMSSFDAGIGQIRGELNSYTNFRLTGTRTCLRLTS